MSSGNYRYLATPHFLRGPFVSWCKALESVRFEPPYMIHLIPAWNLSYPALELDLASVQGGRFQNKKRTLKEMRAPAIARLW